MEHYDSIDNLPIANFDKINTTGDLGYLFIFYNKKFDAVKMQKVWAKIYDEFLEAFGLSDNFKMYIERMQRVIEFYDLAYNQGQRHYITLAEIEKRKAYDLINFDSNEISVNAYVSKYMGFRVDPKTTPVKEFYGYLKLATSGNKE